MGVVSRFGIIGSLAVPNELIDIPIGKVFSVPFFLLD